MQVGQEAGAVPDPEVTPRAKRRTFSGTYKEKILAEVEAAAGSGGIGEILRREGLYSSTLTSWRKERDGAIHKAFSRKRGPEPKHNPLAGEVEKLRRQNQRLQEELRKAEIIIDGFKSPSPHQINGFRINKIRRLFTGRRRKIPSGFSRKRMGQP